MNYLIYKNFRNIIPTIWWIHENIYPEQITEELEKLLKTSKDIYVPSKLTQNYLAKYNPNIKVLCYPISDVAVKTSKKPKTVKKILHFVLIGAISARKGHDIFIEAIKLLPENLLRKARFDIIGSDNLEAGDFAETVKKSAHGIKQIRFFDVIQNQKVYRKLLSKIDVLCCPSREDPFPIVVTEAMMFGKTCIVSDRVGQKDLIKNINGKTGNFIFPSENITRLSAIFREIIEDKVNLERIGEESRKIFEKTFDYNLALENFLKIIESKINNHTKTTTQTRKRKR
jgi:glycosyltransferase involved in cell wall biosynthesis